MWMEAREEKLEVMEKNQTMYKEVMDKRLMVWMEMIGEKVYGLDGSDGGKMDGVRLCNKLKSHW